MKIFGILVKISMKFVRKGLIDSINLGYGFWLAMGPCYWHDLNLIPAWISNYIQYKVW